MIERERDRQRERGRECNRGQKEIKVYDAAL